MQTITTDSVGNTVTLSNHFVQTVPNEIFQYPLDKWVTTSTNVYDVSFGNYHYSNDVTIHSNDIDTSSINVQKEEKCIAIQILANGLIEEYIKVYTMDGKLVVQFLEEEVEDYEKEIILEGFEQPCGKIEFEFSHLYDYGSPKVDLMLGILFISVSKFDEYLKQEIEIGKKLF